jgi:hypothetical protein
MEYFIGIVLALVIALFATGVGLDKDRAFYPTVLIVIALLYGLFAMIGGSLKALGYEALPMLIFITLATVGFKRNAWLVVIGLAGHGIFDFFHGRIIPNPGVPTFWPGFCMTYDVVAAIYLAVLLKRVRRIDKMQKTSAESP